MERTRTVETARFKAKAADGSWFDIVEMTAQEILPANDAHLDNWRPIGRSYRTIRGAPVNMELDGTLTVLTNPSVSVTRV